MTVDKNGWSEETCVNCRWSMESTTGIHCGPCEEESTKDNPYPKWEDKDERTYKP